MSGNVIKYAIVSADNSHYLDYWNIISNAWIKMGITPVLVHINGDDTIINLKDDTMKITLPELKGIKTSLQAQIGRIWATKYLSGKFIFSDIDMMPLNKNYFQDIASIYDDETIVSYSSDAAEKFDGTYPMCYISANAETFLQLIKFNSWQSFVENLLYICEDQWTTDQKYMKTILDSYHKVIHLTRVFSQDGIANRRIDRLSWIYFNDDVKNGIYYDAHLPVPFKENETLINNLYSLI